ncbi:MULTISPECIES: NAD(P)-dependent oxidoreductase [unclassified Enterococcus]|uniref:NAD(P)-dependent oxidoreductase n=1 Tax=unclassified Enterococcus TaxID=2608891 RepID=UPI001551D49C|nr:MULTISPECIES: NAD(P)-dependent oxidoreductase [unclassified Enterococcus]MBS7576380.1 NAD(P)-dependent oxidoreductase [Enterococcus sp. MMGLQ5-2]MBS7583612.1 NAD(P)-dependent oxidoreductase [Enterococcus sp. MMGLQ5-1]NPD11473.1 NAD(P)-dependent oxidoreductase [Enterococcus sp. MMGLQ5-1]NPD36217.1 NAD(P)-dependent oxidoreductase [Enterococcus sp. MMGLQ5-2]
MKIGFIGTGVMGKAIAGHLLAAGHDVFVYNRTKSKTDTLVNAGAIWQDTPENVTEKSEIIFTMIGYPKDVEAVYFGENGIFKASVAGKLLIDMTTSTPTLAQKIAVSANKYDAEALDAPVSGGDIGAKNATLTVMAGGSEEAFNRAKPLFDLISKKAELHGAAGSGQHVKMANQIGIAGTMTAMSELMVYAKAANLDLKRVIETLSAGGAQTWSLSNYGPRILKSDYSPGFFVKHFIKDLGIALDEAEKMSIKLPATELAKALYDQLAEKGFEDAGTQSLIKLWWD